MCMEAATPRICEEEIVEFMQICKSAADDSRRCRQIIGQLRQDNKAKAAEIERLMWWIIHYGIEDKVKQDGKP